MRIESKLCHISEHKAVVQVTGWFNDKNIGSALAEGSTVEIAEDKAITRLNKRIDTITNNPTRIKTINDDKIKTSMKVELPKSKKIDSMNINIEPIDWSKELTEIDLVLERLKWSRDDEVNFLKKNLGFNNRNKITNYKDIVKYLNLLKNLDIPIQSTQLKSNIEDLIEESNTILRDLSWDHIKGREYLQREFNVSTRKELNEEQLISFVAKLKLIQNQ